jgi:hypothetical protein
VQLSEPATALSMRLIGTTMSSGVRKLQQDLIATVVEDERVRCELAWLVLQHAIGSPDLQRWALPLLRAAAERRDVPASEVAMLEDQICVFEGRPQR